jgi:mono/diheme cytochrome c family protein
VKKLDFNPLPRSAVAPFPVGCRRVGSMLANWMLGTWLMGGAFAQLGLAQQVATPHGPISYDRQIRPILSEHCFACHGFDSEARQADLRLDTREGAIESGSGNAIVPGRPEASEVIDRIFATDEQLRMPPGDTHRLNDQQKSLLREWIQQGAQYDHHWAFVPPRAVRPPEIADHPIDGFIWAKLLDLGLKPSSLASPETLLRRVSLDLIGLPPSPDEIDAFLNQWRISPDTAYLALVDRLLASPHYGERFGRWWLDQARYADSNGYSIDGPREIWLYRDWVVQALNDDLPFDQFTVQQIAGDLLLEANDSQKVATGFHRNTQLNKEGGIDPEQFRIESIFDRVATTGTVWLGLTIGCAQCHNHKYDPISQEEYYRLFAFLNNQEEPTYAAKLTSWQHSSASTLVLEERASPRETRILIQGDFTRPGELVQPGTPKVLHPLSGSQGSANRLDLARWLVAPENPLTARVVVNRLWQQFFGRGLVESENDFGLQGSPPSHPELLDWLAAQLVEGGWSLKEMHRLIVTSHTYCQSARVRQDLNEVDPNNLLLGRQTRLRLDAELVRDVALAASGMLNASLGGRPVFPPIPDGVMNLGQVRHAWNTSHGADRYRRAMYTFVFRATPAPSLNVFDAPEGSQSCTRRLRSNTPLQALTLMNDSGFFEFAQALAELIEQHGVHEAFRRCTSRNPSQSELDILRRLDPLSAARVLLNLDETITRE